MRINEEELNRCLERARKLDKKVKIARLETFRKNLKLQILKSDLKSRLSLEGVLSSINEEIRRIL